jgi:beta-glucosidase
MLSFFLPPFQKVIEAGADSVMTSFESLDGTPAVMNWWLLRKVLKEDWGFKGFTVTDWDCVGDLVNKHHVVKDIVEGSVLSVKAGLDMVLETVEFPNAIIESVRSGVLSEALVNDSVKRILAKKLEFGLDVDDRYPDRSKVKVGTPENRQQALEAARQTLILAKNDGTLPISDRIANIALLGYNADHAVAQCGDWSLGSGQGWSGAHPRNWTITVLDGLKARFPNAKITYVPGAAVAPDEKTDIEAAVAAAKEADLTIVVVGDRPRYWGETKSTAKLELMCDQNALLRAIADLHKKFIVNYVGSKPLIIPEDVINKANAVIFQISPGMLGGTAFAEAITGDINPSGRFPITVPRHIGQIPVYYNTIRGQHGDKYADLTQEPQWAFGYGLTYSTITYSDASVDKALYGINDEIVLTLTVWNKGPVAATEVVQVYLHDVVTSATWATQELKAYERLPLKSGESKKIQIRIKVADCSIVNANEERVVEPGVFELWIGKSARDILLKVPFAVAI